MDGGIRSNEAGAFDMQRPRIEHQPTSDIESENSENIEEDVNICDICGDAGQEEKLVICTRCDEGAEHTYCMPIKLNELPEGDWLCEGCQMDKSKIQNANKSETAPAASEVPCLDPKLDPEFCAKAKGQEAESANKEPGGQKIADGKNSGSVEIILLASKKDTINGSGPPNIPTTGENVGFSNENPSSILDVQKVKASTSAAYNSEPVYRAQISSVSNPLSMKAGIQSSWGPLSKSASFNSRMQPKVKQLTGPAPSMQKIVRGSVQSSTSREGLIRKLGKSASCKGMRSSYSNVESMSKVRSVLHRADDKRGSKNVEERNITEKRSFSTSDSEAAVASESEALAFNRRPEDTNHLAKKPSVYLSKSSQNPSSDKIGNSEHHKLFQDLPNSIPRPNSLAADRSSQQTTHQSALLSRNNKTKDLGVGSSKQAGSSINRVLRCQKCNEAGHTAQYCSITKFSVSAVKPSADWNLKEPRGSSNKLKDAVQAEISKTTIQNSKRSINESVKPLLPLTDISCDVASRDPLSNSASRVEETTDDKENSRFVPHTTNTGKPQSVQQVGPLSVPRESNLNSSPDEAPVLARALVIPEMEFIWQGDFDVLKAGRHPELCDRMQAHLSTCASPKVLEVAAKFPYRIEVDEVSRLSSWPLTFHERSPREDNIALFFFAKDNESYEQNYRNLVDNMLENDLALKGSIDGLELLIFLSNVLPKDSQCWNGSFFLWAVFRGRTSSSLKPFADSREKTGGSTSIAVSLPAPLIPEVTTSPKSSLNANHNKESSTCDQSFDKKAANIDADSDLRKIAETSSDLKEGVEASGNEEEQRPTKAEAVTYTDTQVGVLMDADPLCWKPSLNRKRTHTVLTCLTSDRQLECTGEAMQSSEVERFSFGLVDVESRKKMKIEAQRHGNCNPMEESLSGKPISSIFGERERSVGFQVAKLNPIPSFLSGNKLTVSNYEDWKHILMIVLSVGKYDAALNVPEPPLPSETAPADVMLTYKVWLDSDEMCKWYIVASLQTVLQKKVEHLKTAREMMLYLKEMFEGKSRLPRYLTIRALVSTKMVEGSAVRDHMLKMFGYVQELASFDVILDAQLQTDIFLASLSGAFEGFVTNFNINGLMLTNSELLAALQSAEDGMKAKGQVLRIEHKRSLKPKGGIKRKKPLQPTSQKEVGEPSKTPEAKTKKKGKCFSCGKKGHWKSDCQVAKAKLAQQGVQGN